MKNGSRSDEVPRTRDSRRGSGMPKSKRAFTGNQVSVAATDASRRLEAAATHIGGDPGHHRVGGPFASG